MGYITKRYQKMYCYTQKQRQHRAKWADLTERFGEETAGAKELWRLTNEGYLLAEGADGRQIDLRQFTRLPRDMIIYARCSEATREQIKEQNKALRRANISLAVSIFSVIVSVVSILLR